MNSPYEELAQRIRGELTDLDRLVEHALRVWQRAGEWPEEQAFLDSAAYSLHGLYSGLEGTCTRTCRPECVSAASLVRS